MAEIESIRCMQLPMAAFHMLVPNSAVAEIIGYVEPDAGDDDLKTDWYYGYIAWRGVSVPVVSVEAMCQQISSKPGARSRIAIVYHPDGDNALPYVGLVLQDIPRAFLAEQDRLAEDFEEEPCEYIVGGTDIMLDRLVIPDLDRIIERIKMTLLVS